MTSEDVHKVAQGRVWSGEDAIDAGLADELGDLNRALELAAEGAQIDNYKTLQYPVIKKSIYEELIKEMMAMEEVQAVIGIKKMGQLEKELLSFKNLISESGFGRPQCRMPFMVLQD
jgi:protease-4